MLSLFIDTILAVNYFCESQTQKVHTAKNPGERVVLTSPKSSQWAKMQNFVQKLKITGFFFCLCPKFLSVKK
jgi:hypothetical protein